jgi:hypothetical protein
MDANNTVEVVSRGATTTPSPDEVGIAKRNLTLARPRGWDDRRFTVGDATPRILLRGLS